MSSGNRALLPDLIKFSYIPQSEHRIHADTQSQKGKERARSPDYSAYTTAGSSNPVGGTLEEDEHVLVLEFAELGKPKARKEDQFVQPLRCCFALFSTHIVLPELDLTTPILYLLHCHLPP
jgi:hypothetical protein